MIDKILREACWIRKSDAQNMLSPETAFTSVSDKAKFEIYANAYPTWVAIHFKQQPGVPCLLYGTIQEKCEEFYKEVRPRAERIKEAAEKIGFYTVKIPTEASVYVESKGEYISTTIEAYAEKENQVEQLLAMLNIPKKN